MRPALHFTAQNGWINDPHGITYRDGQYHVFFQHVPGQTVRGPNCHWGHATGPDLLTLRELPVAIAPGDGDDGIWTGSLVTDHDEVARIFYTSISTPDFGIGRIRTATPGDDEWRTWKKGEFVVDAPEDLDLIAYRDPFIRKEEESWRMFLGAALSDGTAAALSYTSNDLKTWSYAGIALQRSTFETEPVWMGTLWECPQIFTLDGRAVMVSSVWDDDVLHYAGYAIGSYSDGIFHADTWGRLTYGDSYYAPSLFQDADGRHCLLFWMRGIEDKAAGWAGAHSVPYLLSLDGDHLVATVHPDVAKHRGAAASVGDIDRTTADIVWTDGSGGNLVLQSSGTTITLTWERDLITVREQTEHAGREAATAPVAGTVRIVVDGAVLEVSSAAGMLAIPTELGQGRMHVHLTRGTSEAYPLM